MSINENEAYETYSMRQKTFDKMNVGDNTSAMDSLDDLRKECEMEKRNGKGTFKDLCTTIQKDQDRLKNKINDFSCLLLDKMNEKINLTIKEDKTDDEPERSVGEVNLKKSEKKKMKSINDDGNNVKNREGLRRSERLVKRIKRL
ncbi:hypothetical protein SNEBB_010384 [Seison nebaliae]|nr:hypothetical protein SNEBB_010384 [Seison nebaliae]